MATSWHEKLRTILRERDVDMKTLSISIGKDPSYISKMLNNKYEPAVDVAIAIANFLNLSLPELVGHKNVINSTLPRFIPVRGEVAAGAWMEAEVWDERRYADVPVIITDYASLERSAWHVQGSSMDLEGIVDGGYVITVPYWEARQTLQDGDVVVVEQSRDGLIQRTCKEVRVEPEHFALVPHSSNPRYVPLVIPRGQERDETLEIRVTGLVVGFYKPVGRPARRGG